MLLERRNPMKSTSPFQRIALRRFFHFQRNFDLACKWIFDWTTRKSCKIFHAEQTKSTMHCFWYTSKFICSFQQPMYQLHTSWPSCMDCSCEPWRPPVAWAKFHQIPALTATNWACQIASEFLRFPFLQALELTWIDCDFTTLPSNSVPGLPFFPRWPSAPSFQWLWRF